MPVAYSIEPEEPLKGRFPTVPPQGGTPIGRPESGLLAPKLLRFGAVGGFVCGVDLALVWLFSRLVAPAVAVSMAYILAVAVHFCLNKWWVFENRAGSYVRQIRRYGLTVVACWVCTLLVFSAALHFVTGQILLAKIIAIPPTTLLGFVLMKQFVFRAEGVQTPKAPNS